MLTYPLMCAIQLISAQIGRVTGLGLVGNMERHCPRSLLRGLVGLLVIASVINIGADLGAMVAALKLLIDGPALVYVAAFAVSQKPLEPAGEGALRGFCLGQARRAGLLPEPPQTGAVVPLGPGLP